MASETKYPRAVEVDGRWWVDWLRGCGSAMPDEATARRCAAASEMYDALVLCEDVLAENDAEAKHGSWTSHVSSKEIEALRAARSALSSVRGESAHNGGGK